MRTVLLICFILFLTPAAAAPNGPVRAWEEPLVIPTYEVGPADKNPFFFHGRTYQGAKGPVYPYPLLDKLTGTKVNKTYRALYLENEYLKLCILPELGGRIFYGIDKTNGYSFFYRQHVIKPALIGMTGAWISGGVEWNIPHHHRASTFMPVDSLVTENPGGSKTVWVGETELRHRMKWIVGLTLHPGKSYVEATVKLFNRTPVAHSLLYFANVAVHTNDNYQVVFPPRTQFATQHAKREFVEWPIAKGVYAGVDFAPGTDVSWYKNHPSSTSMFAWNYEDDFLAGYDHGRRAGTLHVANHHLVPGKKFFTWGVGPSGRMWDRILTDDDGPYLELMVGAWSDNQPDYSWALPYETKDITQYWYPFREIGAVKLANLDAAVNLEVTPDRQVKVGFCVTQAHPKATATLRAGAKTLSAETVSLAPGQPYVKALALPAGVSETDLTASLEAGGNELIRYRPAARRPERMPAAVKPPPPPKNVSTIEELYFAGQRLEQFYSPAMEPYAYYEEALGRDPGDYRANTALGRLYFMRGMFPEAEKHLRAAVERVTRNYTRPRDGEAHYYLGVTLNALGRVDEARDQLYRAAWNQGWHAAANYSVAAIDAGRGDYAGALESVEESLRTNARNPSALNLKVSLLRKLNRPKQAADAASAVLAADPLNFRALNEQFLAKKDPAVLKQLRVLMRDDAQNYLELAAEYGSAGMWPEAFEVLERRIGGYTDKAKVYPMLYYLAGWCQLKSGASAAALKHFQLASRMPSDYCFPFRAEEREALEAAMRENPRDARAPYYLGNLLYDAQPQAAIAAWEKARAIDPSFAMTWRNLGVAYARVERDLVKGIAALEKAVALDPSNAMALFDLDQFQELAGAPLERRLALMEASQATIFERDDALSREIALFVSLGKYDRALELLQSRHFHLWEGGVRFSVHGSFVDAHLGRGHDLFAAGNYQGALKDYQAALEYPDNLEIGKPYRGGKEAQIHYFIGLAEKALGNTAKAAEHFGKSVAEGDWNRRGREPSLTAWSDIYYFEALSRKELGEAERAAALFRDLIRAGERTLAAAAEVDYFAKFGERESGKLRTAQAHYLIGIGALGAGDRARARAELAQALESNPFHSEAKRQLAALR